MTTSEWCGKCAPPPLAALCTATRPPCPRAVSMHGGHGGPESLALSGLLTRGPCTLMVSTCLVSVKLSHTTFLPRHLGGCVTGADLTCL